VSDTVFEIEKQTFHFFDVSGLKHHRKQWLPYFDKVTAILFVVSLSSYNQNMAEDPTVNRMADAIVVFDQMVNNPLLSAPNVILFLNKKDLYEKKIKTDPLNQYFPDYNGA
jgi:hypothetical protein